MNKYIEHFVKQVDHFYLTILKVACKPEKCGTL